MSGAVAFGDGNELTLDNARVSSAGVDAQHKLDVVSGSHLERQFLAFNSEHAIAGREVQNVDSVGEAFGVHSEVKRLHPATCSANAQVQAVDDLFFAIHVLDVQLIYKTATALATTATSVGEGGLGQEVTLRGGNVAQAAVAVALDRSASDSLAIPIGGHIAAFNGVVHTDEQVASVVVVRRGESDVHFAATDAQ